jgi:hypothetical protein
VTRLFRTGDRTNGIPHNSYSDLKYPEWQSPFREALIEIDREKLQSKTMKAEEAIFQRLQQLAGTSDSEAERQAIEDALASLRVFKRDRLGFPDWEKK